MSDQDPQARLEPLLLDPTRLRVVASLAGAVEVEFGFIRDRVGLTDSALSKQLRTLGEAGLLTTRRERTGARRRVWAGLTSEGRARLAQHAAALREIADNAAPQ